MRLLEITKYIIHQCSPNAIIKKFDILFLKKYFHAIVDAYIEFLLGLISLLNPEGYVNLK